MKKLKLLIILSIAFFGCLQAGPSTNPPPISNPDTPPINAILITTDKAHYVVGETVLVTVKNNSGKPVFYNRCNSTLVGGKGWWPNCSEEKINDSAMEKTIVRLPCPSGVENFESPNAIATLEDGQTIMQNIPFTRDGKIPICVQARFSYFSSCDQGNCSDPSEVLSGWIEVVGK